MKSPELLLTEEETTKLTEAYGTFCEYHEVPVLTPKRISEVNLIAVCLMTYGTRLVAIRNRMKEQRASNVTQMPNRTNAVHGVM